MSRRTRSNRNRYYLNVLAKDKEHGLKHASLEHINAIIELIKKNPDNNVYLARGGRHAKILLKHKQKAKSDPATATTITTEDLIRRYFAKFDLTENAEKWSDFSQRFPSYNPTRFKWTLTTNPAQTTETTADETETEAEADPQHYASPLFQQSVSDDYAFDTITPNTTTDNSQHSTNPLVETSPSLDISSPSNNKNAETNTTPTEQQQVTTDHILSLDVQVIKDWIDKFIDFKNKNGDTRTQQARMTLLSDLLKYIIYHGQGISDETARLFIPLYPEMTFSSMKQALIIQEKNAKDYLLNKGFIQTDGTIFK